MGIGDKFRDKAQQLEDEGKQREGSAKDDAQQKAAQAEQQGKQDLDDLGDDLKGDQ
ncbi:hypothetical protein LN042_02465 [Kitasatospora sp. RB6PN24]|uniref:hypothetical protein n=1 Tax=Kitasatospora humi TaxID=2893891 RepID=UPI001E546EA1|nr:hypothetical protein [Kitasatospora humi]MCC9305981.1 hypothetical protein [Kitasatospora humi]